MHSLKVYSELNICDYSVLLKSLRQVLGERDVKYHNLIMMSEYTYHIDLLLCHIIRQNGKSLSHFI